MPRPHALAVALLAFGTACSKDDAGDETSAATTTDPPATAADDDTGDPAPTTGDDPGSTGAGDDGDDGDSPVWDTPYCFPVAGAMKWPSPLPAWEEEVLALVNEARAAGGDCGSMGAYGPAAPLTMDASLHCAARVHSKDMSDRDFFDHTNPDGESPFDRMARAGYGSYLTQGENIAAGSDNPADAVAGWLASDGHCANIHDPNYQHTGVGAFEGGGEYVHYWTQTFAAKAP